MKGIIIGTVILILAALLVLFGYLGIWRFSEEIGVFELSGENSERYENMLILYTEDAERNRYGWELLVDARDNYVIDSGTLVELCEGTYILSGHGDGADFLRLAELGDTVSIDRKGYVTLKRNLKYSTLRRLELENERVDDIISERRHGLYDVDLSGVGELDEKISEELTSLRRCFLSLDTDAEEIRRISDTVTELIDEKYYLTLESRAVEGRGIWHRPNASSIDESTLEGVRNFANELASLGINTLYVETLWNGMTTYYSELLGGRHPSISGDWGEYGDDYMLALISECHARGIEVHAWVELLSPDAPDGTLPSYVDASWLCYDETGASFLDPAIPEVGDFLCSLLCEMVEKYDLDGISYDYIRYSDTGATMLCIEGEERDVFEQNAISSLVARLSDTLWQTDPTLIISASPYGYLDDALDVYMQDTREWMEKGYIDVVLPMIYTENTQVLAEAAAEYGEYSDTVLQYTGIAPLYNGASVRVNQELTAEVEGLGIAGISLFASQNYITCSTERNGEIALARKSSAASVAVVPTSEPSKVISAWADQVLDRCERIYSEHTSPEELRAICDSLNALPMDASTPDEVREVLTLLSAMKNDIASLESSAVRARLTEQIDYISKILNAYVVRYYRHGAVVKP